MQLDDRHTVMQMDGRRKFREAIEMFLPEHAELAGEPLANRLYVSRAGHGRPKPPRARIVNHLNSSWES